jgi:hypothetical protein
MNSHQRWLATKSSELDKRMAAAGPRLPGEYDVFGDGGDGEGSHGNKVMVDGYSGSRFSINGVLLPGPLFLLPTLPLAWNVTSLDDLSPESLALAYAIRPRVCTLHVHHHRHDCTSAALPLTAVLPLCAQPF